MKRKIVKITSGFMIAILSLLMVFSLGSVLFVVASYFVSNVSPLSYSYLLMGEAILPLETLINKGVGKFPEQTIKIIIIVIGALLGIISIICIKLFSKASKNKKGIKTKILIPSLIFQLLFCGYFAFNGVYTFLNMKSYSKHVYKVSDGVVKNILDSVGKNFVTIKGIVFSSIIVVLSLVGFITYILCKQKRERKQKVISSLNFYSQDFLTEQNPKEQESKKQGTMHEQEHASKPKPKKQSQDLINRIMQLNELRDTNQISEVEYTKLRTKAIKRYKG